ncbi:MAG: molybdate ABC transporter substrate-binding protein [Halobacteriota archaeon]
MNQNKWMPVMLCAIVSALVIASCGCIFPTTTPSTKLTIFAAASLTDAFNEMAQAYEANHTDTNVTFNFDGSQILRTQIEQGANADVFASANTQQMGLLQNEGMMNNSSITIFAQNKLAIIVPTANPANITNLSDLAKPGVKLVIGNKDVPAGSYTQQMLNNTANVSAYGAGFKNNALANVVSQEPNVNNVVTKVALGEADAGIVYESDVPVAYQTQVKTIPVPDNVNVLAQYPIGILSGSKNVQQAQSWINFVTSPAGQAILLKYGFMLPSTATAKTQTAIVTSTALSTTAAPVAT